MPLNRRTSCGFSNELTGRSPSLDRLEPAVYSHRIAESFRLDVVREIQVEEIRDRYADGGFRHAGRDAWIAAGHDLRQELRFPDVLRRLF